MVSTFHVVLRQEEGYDAHQTREFNLELDSKFAIGRASKNISKGYLLPAKNNVYIDSPVVSREHAILTANATSGTPQVYITDTKSMHGTYVNGTPLVPHAPRHLLNGDKLQFGVNVNRNESYFVAFRYTFNAELTDPEPFSRGFTVPEAESEEEEELGFAHAGRGSQLDPLILDDSDAASEHEEYEDHEDEAEQSEDNADVTLAQLVDEEGAVEIDTSSLVEEEDAADSVADGFDDSDAASAGSALEYNPESPIVQQAQFVEEVVQVQSMPVERYQPSTTQPTLDSSAVAQPADGLFAQNQAPAETCSLPPWQGINNHVTFPSSMFESTVAPPLPPRPSQKRQRIWDGSSHEEPARMLGAPSEVASWSPIDLDHEYREYQAAPFEAAFLTADRIQTPPPTVPTVGVPDAFAAIGDSAMRGTGSSILGGVDEQPPTPTSINSRKRDAAAAFDDMAEEAAEQKVVEPESEHIAPKVAVPTIEQVAQPQRPIAQPKSILRQALNAAKLMVPATALGAVFTVGALTALPESFFTVA
ncbi:hypothetical protein E8E12_007245 [Didymella heteroderae]|uniref:FHA domain-containing protein n=1 Tax=Didymella heteroderae TaxID=1769908 RepID=A0A9P4WKN7_9PLEO|nr:hypothetical protein E8E12_007245 [Didymella heteroderae]